MTIWSGFFWLIAVAVTVVAMLVIRRRVIVTAQATWSPWMVLVPLGLAAILRFHGLDSFSNNRLGSDEIWMNVMNVADMTQWQPTYRIGGTSTVVVFAMDLWYRLVGFGDDGFWIRLPYVLVGCASVLFLFLWARYFFGTFPALAAALMLAVNPYAVFFSKLATDMGWSVLALNVSLFLLTRYLQRPSTWRALIFGTATGTLFFTYPSFPLVTLCLGGGVLLGLTSRAHRASLLPLLKTGGAAVAAGSMLLSALVLLALHFRFFSDTGAMPLAGGSLRSAQFTQNLSVLMRDLLVNAGGWLTPYKQIPFVEPVCWVLIGLSVLTIKRHRPFLLALLLLLPAIALSGPYAGARRAAACLPLLFAFAGAGLVPLAQRWRLTPAVVLPLLVVPSIAFHFIHAAKADQPYLGDDLSQMPLSTSSFLDRLAEGPVFMAAGPAPHFDERYYRAVAYLGWRHAGAPRDRLHLVDDLRLMRRAPAEAIFLHPEIDTVADVAQALGWCIPLNLWADEPWVVLRSSQAPGSRCVDTPAVPPSAQLGYRHAADRMRVRLDCSPSALCDPGRPDFVFASDRIDLKLDPGPRDQATHLDLVFEVDTARAEMRSNCVSVNDRAIGCLESQVLEGSIIRLRTRMTERERQGAVQITIHPPRPDRGGWDIRRVEMMASGDS